MRWTYTDNHEETRTTATGMNLPNPIAYFWQTSDGKIGYKLIRNSLGSDNILGTLEGVLSEEESPRIIRAICECQEKRYQMIFGKCPDDK